MRTSYLRASQTSSKAAVLIRAKWAKHFRIGGAAGQHATAEQSNEDSEEAGALFRSTDDYEARRRLVTRILS